MNAALLAAVLLCLPSAAHAYIDPGSVSVAAQVLIASVAGAAVAFKAQLRALLRRILGCKKDDERDA